MPSETERFEVNRGARPEAERCTWWFHVRARTGRTPRVARNATVAAGSANRDSPSVEAGAARAGLAFGRALRRALQARQQRLAGRLVIGQRLPRPRRRVGRGIRRLGSARAPLLQAGDRKVARDLVLGAAEHVARDRAD